MAERSEPMRSRRPSLESDGPTSTSRWVPRWGTRTQVECGHVGAGGHRRPVPTAAGRVGGAGERRAEHDGVGTAGDGTGDVAAGVHAAVGDEVDVDAGLVEVAHAGGAGVGNGGGERDPDAEGVGRGGVDGRADADEDAGGAGAHQVQRGLVAGAGPDEDRHVELADEGLQVQRLAAVGRGLGDVLGRQDGGADHEHVQLGLDQAGQERLDALGRHRAGGDRAGRPDGPDALDDEVRVDRLLVELAESGRGRVVGQLGDLVEHRLRVGVAGPEALEVEDGQAAEVVEGRRRSPG